MRELPARVGQRWLVCRLWMACHSSSSLESHNSLKKTTCERKQLPASASHWGMNLMWENAGKVIRGIISVQEKVLSCIFFLLLQLTCGFKWKRQPSVSFSEGVCVAGSAIVLIKNVISVVLWDKDKMWGSGCKTKRLNYNIFCLVCFLHRHQICWQFIL